MEKQFTLETRLSLDDEAKKYLNEYKSYLEDQKEALTDSLDKRKEAYSDFPMYAAGYINFPPPSWCSTNL